MNDATIPFQPILRRLVRLIVLVGLSATLIAVLAEFGIGYYAANLAFQEEGSKIADSHLPLLSIALWDIEPEAIQSQVDRIGARPQIRWVRLTTWEGRTYAAGDIHDDPSADTVLKIASPHGTNPLGTLEFAYDRRSFYRELVKQIVSTVTVLVLLTSVICVLLIRLLHRELQQPLERIADFNARLSPTNLTERLALRRSQRPWRDEIDLVAESFNILRDGIQRYVIERDEATAQLARQRDDLDRAVIERTADLTRLNAFLETLSQVSTRFINLPIDQFPDAFRDALETLAHQLGLSACGLAERAEDGRYRWRFVYRSKASTVAPFADGDAIGVLPWTAAAAWHAQYWDTPPADSPAAGAMAAWGARAMAVCRSSKDESDYALICLCDAPYDWAQRGVRQLEMAADMLFSTQARWHDLITLDATRRELWRLSRSDPLTHLPNRRHFDEVKINEARRAARDHSPLAILMIDVDFFKRYNDGYGHSAGDECLAAVASALQANLHRAGDFVARLGGEEFIALLPNTHVDQAQQIGELLQEAVFDLNMPHDQSPLGRVTVSIGAAVMEVDARSAQPVEQRFETALLRADDALYISKAGGRNQVTSLRMTAAERAELDLEARTPDA